MKKEELISRVIKIFEKWNDEYLTKYYYFGDNKDDNGYEEAKLDIKAGKKGSGGNPQTSGGVEYTTPVTGGQQGNIPTSPGFEIIFSMGTLITYCIYSKVMYSRKKK